MPNTAKIPRFLGVKRNPFSSTSLAAPFASTNLFGITSVGVRGPAATAKGGKTGWGAAGSSEGDRSGGRGFERTRRGRSRVATTGTRWKRPRTHSWPDSANARGCVAPVRVGWPRWNASDAWRRKSRRKMSICTCKQSPARSKGSSCVFSRDPAFAHQSVSTPRR